MAYSSERGPRRNYLLKPLWMYNLGVESLSVFGNPRRGFGNLGLAHGVELSRDEARNISLRQAGVSEEIYSSVPEGLPDEGIIYQADEKTDSG